jgi:hypothetical protein
MMSDKKNPLEVIKEDDQSTPASPKEKTAEEEAAEGKAEAKTSFELPEGYLLAKEMRELFEEDIVTHVQGSSEPESD